MRPLTLILALWVAAVAHGASAPNSTLVGYWRFTGMIHGGQEMPPRDPKLKLSFEFRADGRNRLYWTNDEGKTFCERQGEYDYDGHVLHDRATWVNPMNRADCANDPDMQPGRETFTPAEVDETTFRLHLPFGSEELIYVFSRDPQS